MRVPLLCLLLFTLNASAQAQLRPMVYAEETVEAPIAEVWTDWTTAEGLKTFFAKEANIEARPGGAYELFFAPDAPEGSRGNDGGVVLGLEDGQMLNVTWAMPPYMPEIRPHQTVLQLRFTPVGDGRTRIRIYHTGFGDSAAWEEGRAYFAKTWPEVLNAYEASSGAFQSASPARRATSVP